MDKIRVGQCVGQWPRKGGNSGVAVPASPQNECRACNNPGSNAQSLARRSPVFTSSRSEEHTSELQSRGHLVCRLLLEKKKQSNAEQCHRDEQSQQG